MAYLDTFGAAIGSPLRAMAWEFILILPKVVITAVVVLVGYLLGWLLGNGIRHALHRMRFDDRFRQLHIAKPLEKIRISELIGWVVKWYTFVIFAAAGANYIYLQPVTGIMNRFALWFPKLVIAMAIVLSGAVVAEYLYRMVMHVSMANVTVLANIVKYFVVIMTLVLALDQIIDVSVLENVMLILIGGISIGLALAVGIAFGLALKDEAAGWVSGFKKK